MHESSELLPATAPRAARGRNNAREAVGYIGLGRRGLAPSLLASPGDREDERSPAARLTHKRNNLPRAPPPPDPTTNCPQDCIINVVNIPISVVRWHGATQETLSIYNLAPPPVFVCLAMKSASRLHIFFAYRWRGMSSRPRMFQQQPLIHVQAKEPVPP